MVLGDQTATFPTVPNCASSIPRRICPCGSKKRRRLELDLLYLLQSAPVHPARCFTDHVLMFKENPARLGQLSPRSVRRRNLSYTHRF